MIGAALVTELEMFASRTEKSHGMRQLKAIGFTPDRGGIQARISLAWLIERVSQLNSFDDKHGLVVDQVRIAAFPEPVILFYRMVQQRIADLLCRFSVMLTHDPFQ